MNGRQRVLLTYASLIPVLPFILVASLQGTDSFVVTVYDADGNDAVTTVNINVTAVDDAPKVLPGRSADFGFAPGETVIFTVGDVVGDVDGEVDIGSVTVTSGPVCGELSVANGTFAYVPAATLAEACDDSFTFRVCDMAGNCGFVTVVLTLAVAAETDDPAGDGDESECSATISGFLRCYFWMFVVGFTFCFVAIIWRSLRKYVTVCVCFFLFFFLEGEVGSFLIVCWSHPPPPFSHLP